MNPSFDSATKAIDNAHDMAKRLRHGHEQSSPVCIWRKRTTKTDRTIEEYHYTLSEAWAEKPEKVGDLVMTVSASGIERCDGPWLKPGELAMALSTDGIKGLI